MARSPRKAVRVTDAVDVYMLVKEEYIQKGISDTEFADYASEKLGLRCAENLIATARKKYGIPPSKLARMAINRSNVLSPAEFIKLDLLWELMAVKHPEIMNEFNARMMTYRQLKAMSDAEPTASPHEPPALKVVGQGD